MSFYTKSTVRPLSTRNPLSRPRPRASRSSGPGREGLELLPAEVARHITIESGDDPCWLWTGRGINVSAGYGTLQWEGQAQQAHRVVYALLVGPIPHGHHLDHLCEVKRCVSPSHLEPVTPRENVHRSLRSRGIWPT
jgi:hypothetical protein